MRGTLRFEGDVQRKWAGGMTGRIFLEGACEGGEEEATFSPSK